MKQVKENYKRKFEFLDSDKNKFVVTAEVEYDRNVKSGEFTMSGDWGSGGGQCVDEIVPANDSQKRLVEFWNLWHLNGMHAGTPEQEECLKGFVRDKRLKADDYTQRCKFLKRHHKYTVMYKGKSYMYGHGWITQGLPEGFIDTLNKLIDSIEHEENYRKSMPITSEEADVIVDNIPDPKIRALIASLDIDAKDIADISDDGGETYSIHGESYYVLTDDEAKEKCEDYLEDYLWKEAVAADRTTSGLDDWKEEVINSDGYGQILNSWDGTESQEEVDGVWYYIIRQ